MKRSLSVLVLVTFLVLPLFAMDKGKNEINVKLGLNISPNFTTTGNDIASAISGIAPFSVDLHSLNDSIGVDGKTGFVAGVDYFYYVEKNLGLGLGINRAFPVELINDDIAKFDSTNIYLTAKQNIKVEWFFDYIYFVGRLGYGINNVETKINKLIGADMVELSADNGLYWALGIGFEKDSILFEALYSVNYFKLNAEVMGETVSVDATEGTIGVNIGYKFVL